MANKTLLEAVNALFRRASIIAGDSDELTSLTDSARQVNIDQAVQVINEGIDALYIAVPDAKPQRQAESTVTLATGTRAYTLATNFARLHWPLIDKTNAQYIFEHDAGYDSLLAVDPEGDNTGIPVIGVIRPTDSKLYVYPTPTSAENGKVYTYQYDVGVGLSAASDTMPFGDPVYRAMIPAWYQLWKRERRNEFDPALFKAAIGQASAYLPQIAARTHYCPR